METLEMTLRGMLVITGRIFIGILTTCACLSLGQMAFANDDSQSSIKEALRTGQIQHGFNLAIQAAQTGDAWAMDVVGLLYLSGPMPIQRDYKAAMDWLSKAANAGNGNAMNRIGEIYYNGWGVIKNEPESVSWYRRGVEHGSYSAMNNLAICLLNGVGVAKNVEEGLVLLHKAAEKDAIAQENLAKIERTGEFGTKNLQEALSFFEKSAEQGSSSAMVSIAQIYFNGEGTSKDVDRSCLWAILAHTKGRKEASAHIANVCRAQLTKGGFEEEIAEAKKWVDQHPDAFGPLARP